MKVMKLFLCISLCCNVVLFTLLIHRNISQKHYEEQLAVPTDHILLQDVKVNPTEQGYEVLFTLDSSDALKSYLATSRFESSYTAVFALCTSEDEVLYTSDTFPWEITREPYQQTMNIDKAKIDGNTKGQLNQFLNTTLNKAGLQAKLTVMTDKGDYVMNVQTYVSPPNAKL